MGDYSMTIEQEAEELRQQLQLCAAGRTVGVSWRAASDHFAAIIGFAAIDKAHADALCETAAQDMRAAIRRNWDELRENRAIAVRAARA